jgi:hypothetical protein
VDSFYDQGCNRVRADLAAGILRLVLGTVLALPDCMEMLVHFVNSGRSSNFPPNIKIKKAPRSGEEP